MRKFVTAAAITALALGSIAVGAVAFRPTETEAVPAATGEIEPLSPAGSGADLDATIARLQARLRDGAPDARAFASLGLAYLQKGRVTADPSWFPKAEGAFERSLAIAPNRNPDAFVGQGLLANARHDFASGRRWAERAVDAAPYDSEGYGVLSDALIESGDYVRADRILQKMIDLKPDLASFARVSYARELRGDVAGAIFAMERAGDAAGEIGPDAAWVESHLGDLYFGSGRVRRAAVHYRRARAMDPAGYLSLAGLARIAAARGELERAIGLMRRVTHIYPTPAYLALYGDLLQASGDTAGARRAYETVVAEDQLFRAGGVLPDVEITLFFADRGLKPARNVAIAREQHASRPSVRVADALAWALYADGRPQRAIAYSNEALRLGTKDALFYFHHGMISKALGDEAAAESSLRTALTLNPHFSVIYAPQARLALKEFAR
jgi:tetratricopeptide (TPR) repeat protein